MTLDVWIKKETESLRRFRALRERDPKADPDMYREQIEPGGWDEKYHSYEETRLGMTGPYGHNFTSNKQPVPVPLAP